MSSKRVVVAPLDWGLGHATRCIPIILELQKKNCEVLIASSGQALSLLRKEFPDLRYFELPPYNVVYSRNSFFVLSILKQLPRIKKTISEEHDQLEKIINENKIDLVISDNRYGCWSGKIPSIFICHQLNLQLPWAWRWILPLVNNLHHKAIKKFKVCWIPDLPGSVSIAGELVNGFSGSVKYIGILSRLRKSTVEQPYDLAVILSGPEPQRTMLEEIILNQIKDKNLNSVLVRGIIDGDVSWTKEDNLRIVNYLPSNLLGDLMNQSKLIVSRSGYSTIMDLAYLKKKAVLIPTPGQTEQEYLAKRLLKMGICYSVSQQDFDLTVARTAADSFTGFSNIELENKLLSQALDEVLK